MFCKNCGSENVDGNVFCKECGSKIEPVIQQQQPVMQQQPVNNFQQPMPAYAATSFVPARKKSHFGRWIFLVVLLAILGFIAYFVATTFFGGPKDLGIRYTQKDYNNVIQKLGIHITADLGNGETYDNKDILAGDDSATGYKSSANSSSVTIKDLNFKDFNWEFSNYVHKTITLSDVEATAFFNEIAPSFWWFKDTQVKINPDGTILTSSSANIDKMKKTLYSDVADKIPFALPNKVNLYTEGDFGVQNNKITMDPKVMNAGPVPVPKTFTTGDNLAVFSTYLERFYTIVPELDIINAGVKDGQFVFDGTIPTEIKVTPK